MIFFLNDNMSVKIWDEWIDNLSRSRFNNHMMHTKHVSINSRFVGTEDKKYVDKLVEEACIEYEEELWRQELAREKAKHGDGEINYAHMQYSKRMYILSPT